jgi:hypothetical protein
MQQGKSSNRHLRSNGVLLHQVKEFLTTCVVIKIPCLFLDILKLPQGQESRVFHRSNFYDQNAVIRSASAYADFIIADACEQGIPEEQRQCKSRNAEGIPSQEIKKAWSGHFVVNASYVHMGRQTGDDLAKIQEELEEVMSHLQRDTTRMTQFRGWSSRNAEGSKEARERCFHWSAPGTPQLPRLQFSESLHKLSVRLTRFLQIGGMLHDDCMARIYIPPGFAYQLWLDKVRAYRSVLEKNRLAHVTKTAVQLLRRVPPNIPSSVYATVITKDESAVTGGQSQVMLMELQMAGLQNCCNIGF